MLASSLLKGLLAFYATAMQKETRLIHDSYDSYSLS